MRRTSSSKGQSAARRWAIAPAQTGAAGAVTGWQRRVAVAGACLLLVVAGGAPAAVSDPGIVLEIDAQGFALRPRDLRDGESGPAVRVVLGSPGMPTPIGRFPLWHVVLNPAWQTGPETPRLGPSLDTPMGVAKIPFASGGRIALHGAGDELVLGKPISSGCVRTTNADMLRVIAWLHQRGALGPPERRGDGEVLRIFQRPARVVVRDDSRRLAEAVELKVIGEEQGAR